MTNSSPIVLIDAWPAKSWMLEKIVPILAEAAHSAGRELVSWSGSRHPALDRRSVALEDAGVILHSLQDSAKDAPPAIILDSGMHGKSLAPFLRGLDVRMDLRAYDSRKSQNVGVQIESLLRNADGNSPLGTAFTGAPIAYIGGKSAKDVQSDRDEKGLPKQAAIEIVDVTDFREAEPAFSKQLRQRLTALVQTLAPKTLG